MTLVIWVWFCALVVCGIAFLTGLGGAAYLWKVRHTKDIRHNLIIVILATLLALGGMSTAILRLIQAVTSSE